MVASMGPHAVRETKRLMREGADGALSDGLAEEVKAFAACFQTADQKEGMRAFLAKRAPVFTDS
jgi:enoyl-CoA hydratase/carnithine racemase